MTIETLFSSDEFNLFQTIIPYKGTKKGLLTFRIIALIILYYGLYGSIYCIFHDDPTKENKHMWFCYFTNQSFLAIILYFTTGIINYFLDFLGSLKGRSSNTFLHILMHIFYNILIPISFLVSVIYWGLIFPWKNTSYYTFTHWSSDAIVHCLQFIFMTIDWYFITIPTNYYHIIPMIIVGVAYLIYTQIYHSI
eukprot:jgi/Orpsp1_1/1190862/evm.model.d7180000081715.1